MNNTMVDKLLKSIYYDLKSTLAYTSKQNVYREAKKHFPKINRKDVDMGFENQLAPTLHKPVRYRVKRNKREVKGAGEQFQSDLCDMSNIKQYNDNYTFLLTCIDCFSRYSWGKPVRNKSGKVCKRLQTDKGKEYLN